MRQRCPSPVLLFNETHCSANIGLATSHSGSIETLQKINILTPFEQPSFHDMVPLHVTLVQISEEDGPL